MTDLEVFKALLTKCPHTTFNVSSRPINEDTPFLDEKHNGPHVVRVLQGYQAHFEATFDAEGNITSIGQWEDM